jgi:hypothetical protein
MKSSFCLRLGLAAGLLLAVLAPVWAGWVCVNHNPPGGYAMSFVNADTGYAVGSGVFKTFDGGASFQDVTPLGWDGMYGSGVQFVTPDTGYAGCQGNNRTFQRLWKTTDGGDTWLLVSESQSHGAYNKVLRICFLDAQHGYIATSDDSSIRKTTDGGSTWTTLAVAGAECIIHAQFLDSLLGYALDCPQSGSKLWRTTDGGLTWRFLLAEDGSQGMTEMQFVDSLVGYVSGWRGAGPGRDGVGNVMKSSDGGFTWRELFTTSSDWSIDAMSFSSRDTGFVSVSGGTGNDVVARLYKTENGTDFFRVRLPLGKGLYCAWPVFSLKGSQVAYVECAVQKASADDSCFLLKTVDGGGDSLGFWQALTVAPEQSNKGYLLTSVPDEQSLYLLSAKTGNLWTYSLDGDSWRARKPFGGQVKKGIMTFDGVGLVLAKQGTKEFWSYDLDGDSWFRLPDFTGDKLKTGSCITSDAGDPLFMLRGGKTNEFWSFDRTSGLWQAKPAVPGVPVNKGTCLTCDDEFVYCLKGGKSREFWAYALGSDSWSRLPDVAGSGSIKEGSCLTTNSHAPTNRVACLKGGTTENWCYEMDGYWQLVPSIPVKGKTKKGAQLTVDGSNTYYALTGGKNRQIWQTDELALSFGRFRLTPHADNTQSAGHHGVSSPIPDRIVSSAGSLRFKAPAGGWRLLSVYDISGKLVRTADNSGLGQDIGVPVNDLAQGVYLLEWRMSTTSTGSPKPGSVRTSKLVIAR